MKTDTLVLSAAKSFICLKCRTKCNNQEPNYFRCICGETMLGFADVPEPKTPEEWERFYVFYNKDIKNIRNWKN